jgi:hypothetical protein
MNGGNRLSCQLVIEAIMLAVHDRLFSPEKPVEYIVPYTTIEELYEVIDLEEHIITTQHDDTFVKARIAELIDYFEGSFNRKKLERALSNPWKKSPPILIGENVKLTVIYAIENEEYGEQFDPIETELILTSIREHIPLLTDQLDLQEKIIAAKIPIQVYDIENFDDALETNK